MSVEDWSDLRVSQVARGIRQAQSEGLSHDGESGGNADPEGILNCLSNEGLCDWVSVESGV